MLAKTKVMEEAGMSLGSIRNTARIVKQAPVFIAVFNCWNNQVHNSNLQSIGACMQNICLSATSMGLGSLWNCDIDVVFTELEELLECKDWSLIGAISIGYPNESPDPRPRKPVAEVTQWK